MGLIFVGSYASQFKSNRQNQTFGQKSAFWWVCSTVVNKCGHTYVVSYYHNNSLYGTHTKTQKRIPLSLKHNFPTDNGTNVFHKSFLKSWWFHKTFIPRTSEFLNISEKKNPVTLEFFWNSSRIQMLSARMAQFWLETLTNIKSAILVLYLILLQFTYHKYFFQFFKPEFCEISSWKQNYSRISNGVSPHCETHISSSHNFDITQAKKMKKGSN